MQRAFWTGALVLVAFLISELAYAGMSQPITISIPSWGRRLQNGLQNGYECTFKVLGHTEQVFVAVFPQTGIAVAESDIRVSRYSKPMINVMSCLNTVLTRLNCKVLYTHFWFRKGLGYDFVKVLAVITPKTGTEKEGGSLSTNARRSPKKKK